MGVRFWNIMSPSGPLSSRTLMTVLLRRLQAECSNLCWAWFSFALYLAFATTAVTLPSFCFWRRSSHYWERHPAFRGLTIRQLSHSVFFAMFCNKIFLILLVQGIIINPIIKNRIFIVLRYFKICLLYWLWNNLIIQIRIYFWNHITSFYFSHLRGNIRAYSMPVSFLALARTLLCSTDILISATMWSSLDSLQYFVLWLLEILNSYK